MSERNDIVDELDWWMSTGQLVGLSGLTGSVQRARDEIVALRGYRAECERQFQAKVAEIGTLLDRVHQARTEALEEACRICPECANRIKALNTVGADHLRTIMRRKRGDG